MYDPATGAWREWPLPGDGPQAYAVFVDDRDIVWLTDFGANAIVRFDPATEKFTSFALPEPRRRRPPAPRPAGRGLGRRVRHRQAGGRDRRLSGSPPRRTLVTGNSNDPARSEPMGFFNRNTSQAAEPTDEQAVARYRYMLATAPPEEIERAHEEAFASLTPEQRRQALQALAEHVPPGEIRGDDPASLARAATRAEIRQPGTIERAWGGNAGFGLGSWFMATLAASFIGTAIAQSFFDNDPGPGSEGSETGDSGSDCRDRCVGHRRCWS